MECVKDQSSDTHQGEENVSRVMVGHHLVNLDIEGRIILKSIIKKENGRPWHGTCSCASIQGQMVGNCKYSNKLSCSIQSGEF